LKKGCALLHEYTKASLPRESAARRGTFVTEPVSVESNAETASQRDCGTGGTVWVTWETQRRNNTLSHAIGADLVEIDISMPRVVRYLLAAVRTLRELRRRRPRTIVSQSPSIVLASFMVIYCRLTKTLLVIDAHNSGLFPAEGKYSILNRWAAWTLRHCDATIVSNESLAAYVSKCGGRPLVAPDPIPDLKKPSLRTLRGRANVVFICTWMDDEPCDEVAKATALLQDEGIVVYATGEKGRARKRLTSEPPPNLELTGFLSEEDFVQLLFSVDVVLVLTTRKDCLTCGAYEAVAAEKPIVLSDTQVLRDLFYRGTVFCDNTASDIARSLRTAVSDAASMQCEIAELRRELATTIQHQIENICIFISKQTRSA